MFYIWHTYLLVCACSSIAYQHFRPAIKELMSSKELVVLLIIIVIIVIVVYFVYYSKDVSNSKTVPNDNRSNTHNNHNNKRRTVSDDNNKKGLESTIIAMRQTHQTCPCSSGYVCVNGICKSGPTGPCVASGDCMSGEICVNRLCTSPPKNWDEKGVTGYDGDELLVNSHAMILRNNKMMIVPTWWSISEITSIVDAENDKFYYILTENSQLYMALEDRIVRSILSIELKDVPLNYKPIKMVNLDGTILLLMSHYEQNYLFTTVRNNNSTWSVVPVKNLGDHEVNSDIKDIQVATNGDTIIVYSDYASIYHNEQKEWSTIKTNNKLIYIGNSYHNRIEKLRQCWTFFPGIDNIQVQIKPNVGRHIVSATIDPDNCYSVIIVDDMGNCIRRTYPRLAQRNLRNQIRIKPKNKELSYRLGSKVIRTKNTCFMLSAQQVLTC